METKSCVVCGQGSTREDWQDKDFVACDHHSKDEVAKAIVARKPTIVPKPAAASVK